MVTLVGDRDPAGPRDRERVTPEDWLHLTVALLCHDVGYVRGACRDDTTTEVVIGRGREGGRLPRGASDAWLTPYHVDRGKVFVRERAEVLGPVDPERVARAIELTRFPVPTTRGPRRPAAESGSSAPPTWSGSSPIRTICGSTPRSSTSSSRPARRSGWASPRRPISARASAFFWEQVEPYIGDALRYLQLTPDGRQWIANLYAQLFTVEHDRWRMGPHPGVATRPAPPA